MNTKNGITEADWIKSITFLARESLRESKNREMSVEILRDFLGGIEQTYGTNFKNDIKKLWELELMDELEKLGFKDSEKLKNEDNITKINEIDNTQKNKIPDRILSMYEIRTLLKLPDPSRCFKVPEKSPFKFLEDEAVLQDGLVVIGGYTHAGKTTIMTSLALEILEATPNCAFIFYTTDDSENNSRRRVYSQILGDSILDKRESIEEIEPRLTHKIEDTYEKHIYIKQFLVEVESMEKDIINIKNLGYEYIFIAHDHIQKLKSSKLNSEHGTSLIEYCIEQVKELQVKYSLLFFVLSQLNEDGKHVRSATIRTNADVCIDLKATGVGKEKRVTVSESKNKRTCGKMEPQIFRIDEGVGFVNLSEKN